MTTRELFEAWRATLPKCLSYVGGCDGDLEGGVHSGNCPLYGKHFATHYDAFKAGLSEYSGVLERANREAALAVRLRDLCEALKPGSSSDIV